MKLSIHFFSLLLITLFSCSSHNPQQDISQVIESFFKNYHNDYRTVDKQFLSKELYDLIDKAIAREKAEEEKVKNSEFPEDKPLMIEGDVFSSLYEGQDAVKIGDIKIEGNKATAEVEFTNTEFKLTWKDVVILVQENGWKIDDVLYTGHKVDVKGTKDGLLSLINSKL
jgi:hypothetical protein